MVTNPTSLHFQLLLFCAIFSYPVNPQTGPKELTKESLGVNYRALSDLFEISKQRKDTITYDISVQMMEIYNEQVRDLLVTDGSNKRYPLIVTLVFPFAFAFAFFGSFNYFTH